MAWHKPRMDFGFTPEQEQLRAAVRRFLDSECPLERVRALMEAPEPYAAGLWRKAAELGWHALAVDEAHGGLGLAWEDVVVVAEEMGRTLFPSPFASNAVAARALSRLASSEQKERWLPAIASGELVCALAVSEPNGAGSEAGVELEAKAGASAITLSGTKAFVADAQAARLLLVAARESRGISLFAVASDQPGVHLEPLELLDRAHRAANVRFDGVQVDAAHRIGAAGSAGALLGPLRDAEIIAECARMVGAADAAVRLAAEYARTRTQFGHPIGRFQGVKHRLAELYVAVESARSLTYYASWALDNVADASRNVSMAKAVATDALDQAGEDCVQIHGAIGFTWECDAQLYYKYGRYGRTLLGSADHHRERVLTTQGL
jgi:acyl-CoA dehydrogenase